MGSKTRAGFGAEEKGFRWGIFILLMVLYGLFLNPSARADWPKEQESVPRGARSQESGPAIHYLPFTVFRHQANPYAEPKLKLLALADPAPGPAPAGQTAGPHNADQVLLSVYDAVNGALHANATLSGGSTNPTPHNAEQVFLAVYDAVNGAIRVNIVAGGGSGGSPGSPTNSMQMNLGGIFVGTPLYYGIAYDGSTPQTGAFSFLPASDAPVSITQFGGGSGNIFDIYTQTSGHVKTLASHFDASGNLTVTGPITSTLATGTAPFSVTSTTPVTNLSIGGNAATATALASTPSLCSTGYAPTGILANGNATGCASLASLAPKASPTFSGTVTLPSGATDNGTTINVPSGKTLNIASGGTLTCATGSTCPGLTQTTFTLGLNRSTMSMPAFATSPHNYTVTGGNWTETTGSMAISAASGSNSFTPTTAVPCVVGQTYQFDLTTNSTTPSGTFTLTACGVTEPTVTPAASTDYRFYVVATATTSAVVASGGGTQTMGFSLFSMYRAAYDATSLANVNIIIDINYTPAGSALSIPLVVYQPPAAVGWTYEEYVIASYAVTVMVQSSSDYWEWGTSAYQASLVFAAARQTFVTFTCFVVHDWDLAGVNGSVTPS